MITGNALREGLASALEAGARLSSSSESELPAAHRSECEPVPAQWAEINAGDVLYKGRDDAWAVLEYIPLQDGNGTMKIVLVHGFLERN